MKRILGLVCALLVARVASAQNSVGPIELDSTYPPSTHSGRVSVDVSNKHVDVATCYVAYFNRAIKQLSPFYVAGRTEISGPGAFSISKYNPDLTPDMHFGLTGTTIPFSVGTVYPNDMLLMPNGTIYASGFSDPTQGGYGRPTFFSILENGGANFGFGNEGMREIEAPGSTFTTLDTMKVLSGTDVNALVACGYAYFDQFTHVTGFLAARVDTFGKIDSTFGGKGFTIIPASVRSARGHLLYQDSITHEQHILFVGISTDATPEILLGRLKQNGSIDSSFGTNGVLHTGLKLQGGSWFTSKADHVEFDSSNGHVKFYDNKLIVAAPLLPRSAKLPISIIRFNGDGTVDTAYGSVHNAKGIVSDPALSGMDSLPLLSVTNDGSLLVSGSQNGYGAVAKFFYGGIIDPSFGINGIAQLNNGFGSEHYSLLGFIPLGGNVGNKIFAGIGTIAGAENSDFLLARYVPVPIIKLAPITVNFGWVDTGKSRNLSFTMTNYDSVTRIIDSVFIPPNPWYAIVPPVRNVPLAPGASYSVNVRFTPTVVDTMLGVVTIGEHSATGPMTHNVALAGRGIAAQSGVRTEPAIILTLLPNPASTSVSILGAEILHYQIIDALGRTVEVNDRINNTIDISKLSQGIYFLDVTTSEGRAIQKLTIER